MVGTGGLDQHRVFVTSSRFEGDFGGVGFADGECQALADGASLGGSWRAILSQTGTDASDRLSITGPVVTLDDLVVAVDAADLWDGSIGAAIVLDETETTVSGKVWTGSLPDGTVGPETCDDWSTTMGFGRKGNIGSVGQTWIDEVNIPCNGDASFYCLEQ
jgi:hypothetical protein